MSHASFSFCNPAHQPTARPHLYLHPQHHAWSQPPQPRHQQQHQLPHLLLHGQEVQGCYKQVNLISLIIWYLIACKKKNNIGQNIEKHNFKLFNIHLFYQSDYCDSSHDSR